MPILRLVRSICINFLSKHFYKNHQAILVISFLFIILLFFTAKIWLVGDGVSYYAWLRSIIFDHNLNFQNEFTTFNYTQSAVATIPLPNGNLPNVFSIGPAIIWAPIYIILFEIYKLLLPLKEITGYEFAFILLISLISVFLGFLAIQLNFLLARYYLSSKQSLLIALAVLLATPLLQYVFDEANYAHVFAFFFSSLVIFVWLYFNNNYSYKKYLALGLLTGFAALMRWQQAIFLIIPLSDLFFSYRAKKIIGKSFVGNLIIVLFSFFLVFSPQLIAWKILFDKWFLIPQGAGFVSFLRSFYLNDNPLLGLLFSLNHGLFSWHPIFLFSVIGIFLYAAKFPQKGIILLVILALEVILLASTADWWAGAAFGARRVVDFLPVFTVGLAFFLKTIGKNKNFAYFFLFSVFFLIFWNICLWFQYLILIPHDKPLNLHEVINNYQYLPQIIISVVNRSSLFAFLYQRFFIKAGLLALSYCAIIVFGLTILALCMSMKFFPRFKEKE